MSFDSLTDRERHVFLSIIHGFIKTASPVGSRYLAKNYGLNISPATVRNVMTDLEEKGLIRQPHTSAGRVPTNAGYREYVDSFMSAYQLNEQEKDSILLEFDKYSNDVDQIIHKATEILGNITNQLGVVLAPRFENGRIEKIELVTLSSSRLLLVISIKTGIVKTVMVEIENVVPEHLVRTTSSLLNERLYGLSVRELKESLPERFNDIDSDIKKLIEKVFQNTDKITTVNSDTDFHLSGAKNVLKQPEFESPDNVTNILELIDQKDILIKVFNENNANGVSIVIGDENEADLLKNCSLITTTYNFDDVTGTLGIIGPTRIKYSKVVALVEFMSETLNYLVCKKN